MTAPPFYAAFVFAAILWLFADSASAMLHPQQGRFMQRDPLGYVDGTSLYQYVRSRPGGLVDPTGRWGADIHDGRTRSWAINLSFKSKYASRIGNSDNEVDSKYDPKQVRNFPYHFNVPSAGPGSQPSFGDDSRGRHSSAWFAQSVLAASRGRCDEAVKLLGYSLHPLQDYFAHGNWDPMGGVHPDYSDDPGRDFSGESGMPVEITDNRSSNSARPGNERLSATANASKAAMIGWINALSVDPTSCRCLCRVLEPKAVPALCGGTRPLTDPNLYPVPPVFGNGRNY